MEETFIAKIISLLNKPVHYLYIGLFFIIWGYVHKNNLFIFGGISLFLLAFASFTEWCYTKIHKCNEENKNAVKIKKIYNESQSYERMILDYCIYNHTLTYTTNVFEEDIVNAIQSLSFKGMGLATDNSCGFVLYENVLEVLAKYKKNVN